MLQELQMTIREQNIALVHQFYDLLEQKNIDAWAALWADDGVQEMPYAPPTFPSRVVGKAALHQHYRGLPDAFGRMAFPDRIIYPLLDEHWIVIEYRGEIDVLATGKPYNNHYLGLFHLEQGKIKLFREYFDPTVLQAAMGDTLTTTFRVQTE